MEDCKTNQTNEDRKYKKLSTIFLIIALILGILLIVSLLRTKSAKSEAEASITEQIALKCELDSIMTEYNLIKGQYGELNEQLSEKDSAIVAQAKEIEKLINSQSDYRRIKNKLKLLQNQGQEYVHLLDSLYTANETLTMENKKIKTEYNKLSETNQKMSLTQDSLDRKIRTASKLKAYNISLKGVETRSGGKTEVETNRGRRIEKFKISFTLGENAIAEPGNVNLYCRLSIPSGKVLSLGDGDAYTFKNEGKTLQYTIKSNVNYENKTKNVVMYWNLREGDKAVPGTYIAQLFTEEEYIGEASVTIK